MQTPRPDHFTYPHGLPTKGHRSWMRALFAAGLVGAFALGLAVTLVG